MKICFIVLMWLVLCCYCCVSVVRIFCCCWVIFVCRWLSVCSDWCWFGVLFSLWFGRCVIG